MTTKTKSKTKATVGKRPDHLMREYKDRVQQFQEKMRLGSKGMVSAEKNFRLARNDAYHAVVAMLALMVKDINWLVDQAKAEGTTPDGLVERDLAMIKLINEEPCELFAAVGKGMTLKEYQKKPLREFHAEHGIQQRKNSIEHATVPAEPKKTLSTDERFKEYDRKFKEFGVLVRDLKVVHAADQKRHAEDQKRIAELEKENKTFHKIQKLASA